MLVPTGPATLLQMSELKEKLNAEWMVANPSQLFAHCNRQQQNVHLHHPS